MTNQSIRVLFVPNRLQPTRPERIDSVVKERGGQEDLGVTSPAESFVALWTIGWQVDEISDLSPADIALELVQLFM